MNLAAEGALGPPTRHRNTSANQTMSIDCAEISSSLDGILVSQHLYEGYFLLSLLLLLMNPLGSYIYG